MPRPNVRLCRRRLDAVPRPGPRARPGRARSRPAPSRSALGGDERRRQPGGLSGGARVLLPPRLGLRRGDFGVIRAADLIQRKRDGQELAPEELTELVLAYARGEVPDYQLAAF